MAAPASNVLSLSISKGNRLGNPLTSDSNQTIINNFNKRLSLEQLLAAIDLLRDHALHLPFRLFLIIKDNIREQLTGYQAIEKHQLLEKSIQALQTLEKSLPQPNWDKVWIPAEWAYDKKDNTSLLYSEFTCPKTHCIPFGEEVLECKPINEQITAFHIQNYTDISVPTSLPNSVLSLAHHLVTYADTYPGATITISKENCPYQKELLEYLSIYNLLYEHVSHNLSFCLKSDSEELITLPDKNELNVQAKVANIINYEKLPGFENLELLSNDSLLQKESSSPRIKR
jgi:hypothetical protein